MSPVSLHVLVSSPCPPCRYVWPPSLVCPLSACPLSRRRRFVIPWGHATRNPPGPQEHDTIFKVTPRDVGWEGQWGRGVGVMGDRGTRGTERGDREIWGKCLPI
uniref:Uncharacterized protein n=1 Tax=Ficedula albicollis TaxID=59894 RepID=A0A803VR89_FICAL